MHFKQTAADIESWQLKQMYMQEFTALWQTMQNGVELQSQTLNPS